MEPWDPLSLLTDLPEPGTSAFSTFESFLPDFGLEMIGTGLQPPSLPRIRPAVAGAPTPREIQRSWWRYWRRFAEWAQDFHPETVTEETLRALAPGMVNLPTPGDAYMAGLGRRITEHEAGLPNRWQPSRLPAVCMSAADASALSGRRDAEIGAGLRMGAKDRWHNGTLYYQRVPALVARGAGLSRALGRWPWAAFDDGPPDDWEHPEPWTLPKNWWTLPEAVDSLQRAHDELGVEPRVLVTQRADAAGEVAAAMEAAMETAVAAAQRGT